MTCVACKAKGDCPSRGQPGHEQALERLRVAGWFIWAQKKADFDQLYRFHCLRHTAITNVRRASKDIRIAQKFARHVNIASTVRYEHASDEEVARAVKDLEA